MQWIKKHDITDVSDLESNLLWWVSDPIYLGLYPQISLATVESGALNGWVSGILMHIFSYCHYISCSKFYNVVIDVEKFKICWIVGNFDLYSGIYNYTVSVV